jgi:RNA polymerase sigma-70 factor, ECF subfamily
VSALPSLDRADHAVVGADAAGELYQRYGSRIFAFCLSRLGNREEAEDAAQTTFLNAFRSLNDGLVPRFELAWLFRIADNVCRDRRKSAWRRGRVEATRDLQELQDVVSAPERRSEGLVGLEAALASMPDRQRRAILLREWQGLSYEEIAGELGLSRAAVETLIFRARRSLAQGLEAPQAPPRRAHAGFDVGWLLALAKSLFHGGGAVKVATSVAAVAGAGLLVAAPLQSRGPQSPAERKDARAPAVVPNQDTRVAETGTVNVADRPAATGGTAEQRRPRVATRPDAQRAPVPRATGARSVPKGKNGEPRRPESAPVPPAPAPERPGPAAETPASTPGTAPSPPPAPPASLPSLPTVPELPPVLPDPPPLEPAAVPPPPDLPVDVPDVPDLPGLPGLP